MFVPIENVLVHMAFPSKTSVRTLAGQAVCSCLQKMSMFTWHFLPSRRTNDVSVPTVFTWHFLPSVSSRTQTGETRCPCLQKMCMFTWHFLPSVSSRTLIGRTLSIVCFIIPFRSDMAIMNMAVQFF